MYREEVLAPGRQDLLKANNPVFRSANLFVAPLTFCALRVAPPRGTRRRSKARRHFLAHRKPQAFDRKVAILRSDVKDPRLPPCVDRKQLWPGTINPNGARNKGPSLTHFGEDL